MFNKYFVAFAVAGLLSAACNADDSVYVQTSQQGVLKSSYGNCVRTGYWNQQTASEPNDINIECKSASAPIPAAVTTNLILYFDYNQSSLSEQNKMLIQQALQNKHVGSVAIQGHADQIASEKYNEKLSQERVNAVVEYLETLGINTNVYSKWYGETKPVVTLEQCRDNSNKIKCLSDNRRVVIKIISN